MKILKFLSGLTLILIIESCSSTTTVSFLCNQEDVQIYVNDDYVGTGLVHYTAPKNVTTADVECKKDGITIFTRSYYIKGHNRELFDLNVPERMTYSSDTQIHSK